MRLVDILRIAAVAWLLLALSSGTAWAADAYPTRPVTLIVGSAAGGGIDTNARLLAERLAQRLGQSVVVENRPGAGARVALDYVARSAPDGHILLVTTAASAIEFAFRQKEPVDTERELTPVTTIASTQLVLVVNPKLPVGDVAGLVAYAKAMPGKLNFSSSGPGTTGHLYGELFKLRTGTDIVHIPYKGTAPALTALLSGEVDMTFATMPAVLQYVKAGRLRALATTGAHRADLLPDVPTMAEAGVADAATSVWYGVLAPPGTPAAVIDTLHRAIVDVTSTADYRRRMAELGAETLTTTPAEFAKLLHEETKRWQGVIEAARLRAS